MEIARIFIAVSSLSGVSYCAAARIADMMMLPLSSETGAEREQSQMIFLKPWRSGP